MLIYMRCQLFWRLFGMFRRMFDELFVIVPAAVLGRMLHHMFIELHDDMYRRLFGYMFDTMLWKLHRDHDGTPGSLIL